MSTDKDLLVKALIKLGITVFLFILTPIMITISFKALDKYTEAPKLFLAYTLILISTGLLIFTLIFAFKTFKVLGEAIFKNK